MGEIIDLLPHLHADTQIDIQMKSIEIHPMLIAAVDLVDRTSDDIGPEIIDEFTHLVMYGDSRAIARAIIRARRSN